MGKNNHPKRNHHVLPKFYLKGFAIDNDESHIWVYKRGESYNPGKGKITNNPYHRSIQEAGAEEDFYADPKAEGGFDFDSFENSLEKLEKPANGIFQKLRSYQDITLEEKSIFSCYITLIQRRVWAGRDKIKELLPETIANLKLPKDLETELAGTPDLQKKWKQVAENLKNRPNYHISLHNRISVAAPDSLIVQVLQSMRWTFYRAPKFHAFLTGDDPVFIPKQGIKWNYSELSFPISSCVALNASWDETRKEGFEYARPQILKEINRRTASQSSRIYFSQNPAWVVTMFKKNTYSYHPMYTPKSYYKILEDQLEESHLQRLPKT